MNQMSPRFWEIFYDVYGAIPRQGPGNRASAERALRLCTDLPPSPVVLDLGCGVGAQTIYLAAITSGSILAVDSHPPSIERLNSTVDELGISQRVRAIVGDMASLDLPPASYDLIWSEGALYQIGIERALQICHVLLRPGGYLVFTDAIWRKENPPDEVKAGFDMDYPSMGWLEDILAAIQRSGFELAGHFTLPDEAWWDDFYTPMALRIEQLRGSYGDDAEATAILDQLAREPEIHRRYSDFYAYEFFVGRRPSAP